MYILHYILYMEIHILSSTLCFVYGNTYSKFYLFHFVFIQVDKVVVLTNTKTIQVFLRQPAPNFSWVSTFLCLLPSLFCGKYDYEQYFYGLLLSSSISQYYRTGCFIVTIPKMNTHTSIMNLNLKPKYQLMNITSGL